MSVDIVEVNPHPVYMERKEVSVVDMDNGLCVGGGGGGGGVGGGEGGRGEGGG